MAALSVHGGPHVGDAAVPLQMLVVLLELPLSRSPPGEPVLKSTEEGRTLQQDDGRRFSPLFF